MTRNQRWQGMDLSFAGNDAALMGQLMLEEGSSQAGRLAELSRIHATKILEAGMADFERNRDRGSKVIQGLWTPDIAQFLMDYAVDVAQRSVLFTDLFRRCGNDFIRHEERDAPPVLAYDYKIIQDARSFERPANYALVRIIPPEGTLRREDGRPYIIIDPRAGHGSGIGGFKHESQVGCALREGHPVYFVIFFRDPVPGQTLADVCAAEAEFVREVGRRHPHSPHPVIIGNCQGGWGAMLLAASYPEITGPVIANGAPLSYWSGDTGKNPMRYLGGILGGAAPVMFLSDLCDGRFDGANLVLGFETLNPANTWWGKYCDVFAKVDEEAPRYLQFENWWSGFYFLNEEEMRWILDNLFIGNKLARGQANLDARRHADLRAIRSPIIIFASHGDNITPPQQALNWIADNYQSLEEIRARGQRILYTLHEDIGHLGIFVSSKIARKQHTEIVSTLKSIEALAPGLYELVITKVTGEGIDKRFTVAFEERTMEDVLALDDGRGDERPFAAVARLSELGAEAYDLSLRPFVKAIGTPGTARALTYAHPLRQRRYALSDRNPLLAGLPPIAKSVRETRKPVGADNPFLQAERFCAELGEQWWNLCRDLRDAWVEMTFFAVFASPVMKALGDPFATRISDVPQEDLRWLPEVQLALDSVEKGHFAEGVIRMLILLAHARGSIRRSRLERSSRMLETTEPFASLRPKKRTRIIHEQSLIVAFEPERALATLPKLIRRRDDRARAMALCLEVAGPVEEMNDSTVHMVGRLADVLGVANPIAERAEALP